MEWCFFSFSISFVSFFFFFLFLLSFSDCGSTFSFFLTTQDIGSLRQLVWLNLSGNFLEQLPDEFVFLGSLLWLDLSNNKFSALPTCIIHLTTITELNLQGTWRFTLLETLSLFLSRSHCFFFWSSLHKRESTHIPAPGNWKSDDTREAHGVPKQANFYSRWNWKGK